MKMPKFHDKGSLILGFIFSLVMVACGILDMLFPSAWWWFIPISVGLVLAFHCLDMVRYYKSHRIVKIVKTDKYREIYK